MRKIFTVLILLTLLSVFSINSYAAGVSSAAVLFLRIAAGARAAGMGEAFVAVADDATATHWNPAGLGNYPLTSKWFEVKIPEHFRPLKKTALFKNDAAEIDYRKYDIWAISEKGLVKHSLDKWHRTQVIETRPDQAVESIVRDYTGLTGDAADEKLVGIMDLVGQINNPYPVDSLDTLENRVMHFIPEDYDNRDDLENAFIALRLAYNDCRIIWDKAMKINKQLDNALKDSVIIESEADKVLFAVEKAKRRFIKEEIIIPFEVLFDGELNDIAADDRYLWVAGKSGLYRYNGKRWQQFGFLEPLVSRNILSITLVGKIAYIGTEDGLVIYQGATFDLQDESVGLPKKLISKVAVISKNDVWAIVDNDLYHYDGTSWKNYIESAKAVDMEADSIYIKMKIFDLPGEREAYLKKLDFMDHEQGRKKAKGFKPPEIGEEIINLVDSIGVISALKTLQDSITGLETTDTMQLADAITGLEKMVDSIGIIEAFKMSRDSSADIDDTTLIPELSEVQLSSTRRIPYTAGIIFKTTDIEVDAQKNLWIGTNYGLLKFDGKSWKRYGYRDYTVEEETSVFDLAFKLVKEDSTRARRLAANITTVNQFDPETILAADQVIKIWANPAGAKINDIRPLEDRIYFATEIGTIMLADHWSRYHEEGLGKQRSHTIEQAGNNIWFTSEENIKIRAGAKSELVMMHVNWLPTLADDIYYEFFSYVQSVEGWGTVGGNITFLSYGTIIRTDEFATRLGDFSAFDIAMTLSYGTPLSKSLSGGLSAKIIYSHLAEQGSGKEKGSGTSTGLALDFGLLYKMHRRLTLGIAVTNIGPDISYIDVSQSDPLPRNLAFGIAWKAIETNYNNILMTIEMNKALVGFDDFSEEAKEVILNGGVEYWYGSFIAFRGGYIYDQVGEVKTPTLGFGLAHNKFKFDFAYIPSSEDVPLANTMRLSLTANF